MTGPSVPLPRLRKAATAYTLLSIANIPFVVFALLTFASAGEASMYWMAIGAFALAYACAINASRFIYEEGGVKRALIGFFVPIYNLYLPFAVSSDAAKLFKSSGLHVTGFNVSRKSFSQLAKTRQESLVYWLREQFYQYLESPDFMQFCKTLAPGANQAAATGFKTVLTHLAYSGEPVIACTVMRNTILNRADEAAPALVMGTFDFSQSGWRRLINVMSALIDADEDSDIGRYWATVLQDDEYQPFRRRPLSDLIAGSSQLFLFDELMRGSDLPDMVLEDGRETNPITVLLATRDTEGNGISAVMPREIAAEALKRLIVRSTPPPLVAGNIRNS